jgi:hypothetical protein
MRTHVPRSFAAKEVHSLSFLTVWIERKGGAPSAEERVPLSRSFAPQTSAYVPISKSFK